MAMRMVGRGKVIHKRTTDLQNELLALLKRRPQVRRNIAAELGCSEAGVTRSLKALDGYIQADRMGEPSNWVWYAL